MTKTVKKKKGMKKPASFEEWSNFTYDKINTPWLNAGYKKMIDNLLFYVQMAYPHEELQERMDVSKMRLPYKMAHFASLLRFKTNFYTFQWEANLFNLFKKYRDMSRQNNIYLKIGQKKIQTPNIS